MHTKFFIKNLGATNHYATFELYKNKINFRDILKVHT
jgi:hypothetical protein